MSSFAFQSTKWALRLATKMIKADVRLHNAEVIQDDMSIMFVVNHFTRLETILLPYAIYKETGKEVWSIAAAELFAGKIGAYMKQMGTVSTKDPDRDTTIIRGLLLGEHPWIIFPEGAMIKDKKVVDHRGTFSIFNKGARRPPHTGAAALALRAEFYRHKIRCIYDRPGRQGLEEAMAHFQQEAGAAEAVLAKRTVIIPVNITYFPMRARDNVFLRMARGLGKDLSPRAVEELSVEGTVLSNETDIDVVLGEPIDVGEYLQAPEFAELMACGLGDLHMLEDNPRSSFNEAARRLMLRYMADIYRLTTVNFDHIFATIIRYQRAKTFSERAYRNRIFLCAHELKRLGHHRLHSLLDKHYRDIIYEDESPKFTDFVNLCLKEGVIVREGNLYRKILRRDDTDENFQWVRMEELTRVIANEIEPLTVLTNLIKDVANLSRPALSKRIGELFQAEDRRIFEEDYAKYCIEGESKPKDVGEPTLLLPERYKAGVVLVHGYLAAPMEVRALGEHLRDQGYAVYLVRLRGHGTAPEDLAATPWEEWYESVNRGYAVIKSLTDHIILGGFSTGGLMALLAAGRKREKVQAVFSICAPLKLQNYGARLAPAIVGMNTLLHRIQGKSSERRWIFVENNSENKHINYLRNPLAGVRELGRAMEATEAKLPQIVAPTLVVQSSRDPVVSPDSGQLIFYKVGTPHKEMVMFERHRHGIVNGPGAQDVFDRVVHFLDWAKSKAPEDLPEDIAEPLPSPFTVAAPA